MISGFKCSQNDPWIFTSDAQTYDDDGHTCNCSTSLSCTTPSKIYERQTQDVLFRVPGFRSGCYVLESLLVSSFQCFYEAACVNQLSQRILSSSSNHPLLSLPSKFNRTDTFEIVLGELLIENWTTSVDCSPYFHACSARTCSYSFVGHESLLRIVTLLLGFLGGLATVLRMAIPFLVRLARRKKRTTSGKPRGKFYNQILRMCVRNISQSSPVFLQVKHLLTFFLSSDVKVSGLESDERYPGPK